MITFSGGVDYDDSIVYCTFLANSSMPHVNNRVDIYDDTIDENRQFFFIHLEVKSATNRSRVKLTTSITKCYIYDNDGKSLTLLFYSNNSLILTVLCLKE